MAKPEYEWVDAAILGAIRGGKRNWVEIFDAIVSAAAAQKGGLRPEWRSMHSRLRHLHKVQKLIRYTGRSGGWVMSGGA